MKHSNANWIGRAALIPVLVTALCAPRARADEAERIEREIAGLQDQASRSSEKRQALEQRAAAGEHAARDAEAQAQKARREADTLRAENERLGKELQSTVERSATDATALAEAREQLRAAERAALEARRAGEKAERELQKARAEWLDVAEGSASWGAEVAQLRTQVTELQAESKARDDENLELKRINGSLRNALAKAGASAEDVAAAEKAGRRSARDLRDEAMKAEESRQELVRRWREESEKMQRSFQRERDSWALLQKSMEEQIALLTRELEKKSKAQP